MIVPHLKRSDRAVMTFHLSDKSLPIKGYRSIRIADMLMKWEYSGRERWLKATTSRKEFHNGILPPEPGASSRTSGPLRSADAEIKWGAAETVSGILIPAGNKTAPSTFV